MVQLLLKDNIQILSESYGTAEKRLKLLEEKLEKQADMKKHYYYFMKKFLQLKHMEEVLPKQLQVEGWESYYIPHHVVVREDIP